MLNSLTCIIPFYNERPRISAVIEAVLKVQCISQIICVDDGSTDGASDMLKSAFPNVALIHLHNNVGKTGAIFAALPLAKNKDILLLDGDLLNIDFKEIENACMKFFNNSLDLLILRAHGDPKYKLTDDIIRHYLVLSGNRILKKTDLEAVKNYGAVGFQIEAAINKYIIDNNKKSGWVRFSALNARKDQKYSFWYGAKKDLFMHGSIIAYLGIWKMLKQYAFFCKDEVV
jgi:glycosyltransferase involved in cell wall biosynthesis